MGRRRKRRTELLHRGSLDNCHLCGRFNFLTIRGIKLIDRVAGATMTDDPAMDFSMGEKQSPRWTYQFVDLTRIEAGEHIVPAKIDSQAGREYAALQSVLEDLSFALECLREADKLGLPDSENIHSKALIFSAVVAYARPFKTSVRERGGPGCLNRFSASISGASAGVRLPCGVAAG
jgi:hypothetical protein